MYRDFLGEFYPSSTGLSSNNQDFVITSSGNPIVQLIQSSGNLKNQLFSPHARNSGNKSFSQCFLGRNHGNQ